MYFIVFYSRTPRISHPRQVERTVAQFVVRDVSIGNEFSVIINAYKPAYMYWECRAGFGKTAGPCEYSKEASIEYKWQIKFDTVWACHDYD